MNMKKYLITFYEIENDVWRAHFFILLIRWNCQTNLNI